MTDDQPDVESLTAALVNTKDLLERLRYAHVQLRLLLEAGETRFLGRAIDELVDADEAVESAEQARTSIVAPLGRRRGLPSGLDLDELAGRLPLQTERLRELQRDLIALLEETHLERTRARSASHALGAAHAAPRRHRM